MIKKTIVQGLSVLLVCLLCSHGFAQKSEQELDVVGRMKFNKAMEKQLIAESFYIFGKLDSAKSYYLESIYLYPTAIAYIGLGSCLRTRGGIRGVNGEIELAKKEFDEALSAFYLAALLAGDNHTYVAIAFINLGGIMSNRYMWDNWGAIGAYRRALVYTKNEKWVTDIKENIAAIKR